MRSFLLVIALSVSFQITAQPDTVQIKKIQDLMQSFAGQNPGVSLSVVHESGWHLQVNHGLEHYGRQNKCDAQTLYNTASLSKHVTAKWIYEFIRAGVCSPDDPITEYLDWLPQFYSRIQIQHLIEHTSGLREFHTLQQLRGINTKKPVKAKQIKKDLIEFQELSFEPGNKHMYSNTGYFLLHEIGMALAEKHPDLSWNNFSDKSGLVKAFWQDGGYCHHCSKGHIYTRSFVPVKSVEKVPGYSNLWASGEDMSQWMLTLLKDDQFLKDAMMVSGIANDISLKYNYGLIKTNFMAWDVLEHGGITGGFRSQLRYIPSVGYGICMMMNSDVVNPADYVDRITEIILKQDKRYDGVEVMGQVVNSEIEPIPYAMLQTNDEYGTALTNDSGYFHYRTREFVDSIKFSAFNYRSSKLSSDAFSKPVFVELTKVEGHFSEEKYAQQFDMNLNIDFEKGSLAPWVSVAGAEVVKRFPVNHSTHIDSLAVFITDQAEWQTPFRFVVFENASNGMPGSLPVYTSEVCAASKANQWVFYKPEKGVEVQGPFFVGIQWLTAAGRRGDRAQYAGFKMNENSNQSFYRVPFDKWRRFGEIMFRGNRDVMIECAFRSAGNLTKPEFKNGFLYDSAYQKIMPLHIEHGHMFIEPYPNSRELRFEADGPNQWMHEKVDWGFEAAFDKEGKYIVYERSSDRIDKSYRFVEFLYQTEVKNTKQKTFVTANGDIKWKVKLTGDGLKVRLKPFRYLYFKPYANDYYFLPGDMSFGRLLKLEWNNGQISTIHYSDSRNMGIKFIPRF